MGKDIDSLLKEVNDIEIPESISKFTDEVLMALPEKNKKKKIVILKKLAAAVAIVMTAGLGVSYAFPSFAEAVPVLKDVVTFLRDNRVLSEDSLKYTKEIKQTISDNGITLDIQKVMLTDSTLKIFYTVETEKHMEWGAKINESVLYIDGKKVDNGYWETNRIKISAEGEKEKYACMTTLDISRAELKEEFDVRWDIKSIHRYGGNWRVAFKADKKEISKETYIFKPNYLRECEGVKETFEKIVVSPIETSIMVNLNRDSMDRAFEKIGLPKEKRYGKDRMSDEEVKKMFAFEDKVRFRQWNSIILDDKGNTLSAKNMNQSQEDHNRFTYLFSGLKDKPKSLTIIPFDREKYKEVKKSEVINLGNIENIKKNSRVEITKDVVLIVNNIERNGNKVNIKYTFEGKYYPIGRLMGNVALIDNKDDEEAYRLYPESINYWRIDSSKDNNEYSAQYEIHEKNSYRLEIINESANYKINEDKAFTIELKE